MKLPLFPLHTVLFPGMALPLHIFEPRYREMIADCRHQGLPFGVVSIRSGGEVGGVAEPHTVGTSALIAQIEKLPDGRLNIETVGHERFRILALHYDRAYLTGTVETFPLAKADTPQAERAAQALTPWIKRYLGLISQAAETPIEAEQLPQDPASLAYLAAIVAQVPPREKQSLLATPNAAELLEQERALYRREVSLLRVMLDSERTKGDASLSLN